MSAFDRPEPSDIPVETQLRWWAETCTKRDASRRDRLQRGQLSPWVAERDSRFEAAVSRSLEELHRRTAITSSAGHK